MRIPREDLRVPDAQADLYLVGLGIGSFERRTIETHQVLETCAVILHLTAFDAELKDEYDGDVVNMLTTYEAKEGPSEVYQDMVEMVYTYTQNNLFLGPVAFLTYGHPLFLVDSSWDLITRGQAAGLRVKPIASTSYIDQVLCDLGRRFDRGVQQYLADVFVSRKVRIDERFPLLLAQVGDFQSDTLRPQGNLLPRMADLLSALHAAYPPDRRCHLIMSSWRSDMAPEVRTASIAELETLVSAIHVGCSLYVEGQFD
ncbi:MAG: SAM-dependent methyltransferase [Rhodoglobus sp.]